MKNVRINKSYGTWKYRKEIDIEDNSNYVYYLWGIDQNGKEWAWMTPFYNEILEFIKADDKTKEIYLNY